MGFWNWANRKLNNVRFGECVPAPCYQTKGQDVHESLARSGLNFSIIGAQGGFILERSTYDTSRDRHDRRLFLISEQEDLSARVGEIVAMEMLRG